MNYQYLNNFTLRRVKERSVGDAYERVKMWRKIFEEGVVDEYGNLKKLTLKQAAECVKIPKKTLEDYTQIFNKVRLVATIEMFAEKKMGYLRAYMKKNKSKIRKAVGIEKLRKVEQKFARQTFESDSTIFGENSIKEEEIIPKIEEPEEQLYMPVFEEETFEDSFCIFQNNIQVKYEED